MDGAVWPWLLGMHAEAAIRAFGRDFGRLDFEESLLAAIDGAPEAWAEDARRAACRRSETLTFPPAQRRVDPSVPPPDRGPGRNTGVMKVLVLGWEYPPAVAGGLGAACHGLTTALADRGHEVILCTPADGAPADPAPYPGIERVSLGGDASFSPVSPRGRAGPLCRGYGSRLGQRIGVARATRILWGGCRGGRVGGGWLNGARFIPP